MRRIFLTACLVILASAAHAEDCDRSDDSQQMMNICANEDFSAADAKLNATYQNLISASDANTGQLLQSAQRAWIVFRDAECEYTTAGSEDGSIHPMEVSECLTRLTNDRIAQLTATKNCDDGDVDCTSPDEDEGEGDLQ